MSLGEFSIGIIHPTDVVNHRIFTVNGATQEFVLLEVAGIIYLNSMSRDYLMDAFDIIKGKYLDIIDITGQSKQYGGLSGFLLKTDYKELPSGARAIAQLLRTNQLLIRTLDQKKY